MTSLPVQSGLLSRTLRRSDAAEGAIPTQSMNAPNQANEEVDAGVFAKFGSSPAPHPFSRAMRIPNGFGSGPAGFPVGSLNSGSVSNPFGTNSTYGSLPFFISPEVRIDDKVGAPCTCRSCQAGHTCWALCFGAKLRDDPMWICQVDLAMKRGGSLDST